ncbi:FecR domain-containing protein [Brevundimonas sp. SORGH_AS_0993]|uniref:FecR family protein n=1 Tax=Brevundimonas sp. SORGH_AS_0993 TaxID=3041794 RepID=UPI0027897D10|nr:FecR domain-containing protein [Brevundimonas sp. SORGH_AS_0993]MDQ1153657.1 transmembrane sensor [Brevundimonas sp. SORGH_AS_0993]
MIPQQGIEEEALGWFVRLQDADACAADWDAFSAWIAASPDHARAYDRLERLWVDLDEAAPQSVRIVRPANDNGLGRRRLWAAMATVAAAAVIGMVGWPMYQARDQHFTTTTEPRRIELADGSVIRLNRRSDLTVKLTSGARRVSLNDGEAAFDVAHDAARPFTVAAGDSSLQVLGTAFNVINHDHRFSVGVSRGVVAVRPAGRATPVRLTVGQQIERDARGAVSLSRVDPRQISAWQDGVLLYRDSPLSQVGADLSRYLGKSVKVSASAQELHFTGALRLGDETTMLNQLQAFAPIAVQRTASEVRLTARGER